MDTTLPGIIEQLTEARGKVAAEVARIDELMKERALHALELERIDCALEALRKGRPPPPASIVEPMPELAAGANGTNGHKRARATKPATVEYKGALGRVVRLLEKKSTALPALTIHKFVGTKGAHEAATYGVLKRAMERGIVRRTGEAGGFRFELARQ